MPTHAVEHPVGGTGDEQEQEPDEQDVGMTWAPWVAGANAASSVPDEQRRARRRADDKLCERCQNALATERRRQRTDVPIIRR